MGLPLVGAIAFILRSVNQLVTTVPLLLAIHFLLGNFVMIFIDLFANIAIFVLVLSQVGKIVHLFDDLKLQGVLLDHLSSHNLLQIDHSKHP